MDIREIIKANSLIIYGLVFLMSDCINFIINKGEIIDIHNSVSFYPKGVLIIISLIGLLTNYTYNRHFLLLLIAFSFIPVLGYLDFYYRFPTQMEVNVFYLIKQIIKYTAAIILYQYFLQIKRSLNWQRSVNFMKILFVICAIQVIISFLFKIQYFTTYGGFRFGYKPPFEPHNDISLFWFIGIILFFTEYYKRKEKKDLLLFFLVLFAAILLGTKAILLFVFFGCVFFIYKNRTFYNKSIIIGGVLAIFILFSLFIFYSGMFSFFRQIYFNEGFWDSLFSLRTSLVEIKSEFTVYKWNWYNYIIGGSIKQFPLVEMNIVDLFWFVGGAGTLLYFLIIFKYLFNIPKSNFIAYFFVFSFLIIGALAGHVYSSGINSVYIAFIVLYLKREENSNIFNYKQIKL